MEGIAKRLQTALEVHRKLGDVRSVFEELTAEGASRPPYHTTYSTVARYFAGNVKEPPLEFLRAAAEVLGVRPAWLAFGEEPMTPTTDPRTRAMMRAKSGAGMLAAMTRGASEPLVQALLRGLVDAQPPEAPEPDADELRALVFALQLNIHGTLHGLMRQGPEDRALQFVVGTLSAMLAVVPPPGQGRPIQEVVGLLTQRGEASRSHPDPQEDDDA